MALAPVDVTHQETDVILSGLPDWAFYTFGVMFVLIGLLLWAMYPKAKRNADRYRKEQLIEYNKQKNKNVVDYKRTGMYLPAWQKAKLFAPALLGTVMIILGISWLAMRTLGHL